MKKALAILLALSMVFAAFADAPAADFSVVSFSGNAALEWVSDLDNEKNGFNNTTEAAVKINLFNAGDAATSGEGVWGELKIVTDKDGFYEVKDGSALAAGLTTPPLYAKVDTAKIHFVDGDVGIALNILKPGLTLGENVLPTAVGADFKSEKFDVSGPPDLSVEPILDRHRDPSRRYHRTQSGHRPRYGNRHWRDRRDR